ncbi:hypothetical protein DRQ07_09040 [candidate division KSB1 bacterium]|nr:MAG: hypothetical protein DRQ07_09040 [candidate division KSB1 bacterium]
MSQNPVKKKLIQPAIIGLLFLLSVTGLFELSMDKSGLDKLADSNDRYLTLASQRALTTFGVLTGLKIGLAVIEGSEIGVGVNLQVGDAVQAAYDYVDIAWRTVLYSTVILAGIKYLLLAADYIDQWFLQAALFLLFVSSLLNLLKNKKKKAVLIINHCAQISILIAVVLFLILPFSIAGGRLLSNHITKPSVSKAENDIADFKANAFPQKVPGTQSGLWGKVNSIKDQIVKISEFVGTKSQQLSVWLMKIIAGYIFDCLIFPFLLFIFLFWLVKIAGYYIFGLQNAQTIKSELAGLIQKAYPDSKK